MAINQVNLRTPDGDVLGAATTDKIGFYGGPVSSQQQSASQNITVGAFKCGTVYSIQSVSVTPSAVAANTCAAQALTCTGSPTSSNDYIVHNKITAQAGLGVSNVRAGTTASTIVVNYANLTSSSITPTAQAQTWATFINQSASVTLSPTAVAANTTVEQIFTVTGVSPTAVVHVSKPTDQAGLGIAGYRAAGNNQLGITFLNATASPITPTASEAYTYLSIEQPGFSAAAPIVILGANVGTLSAVNATTAAEQAVTVTGGVLATDYALGSASKPTAQANIGIVGVRVSAANVLGVTFVNPTATTTTPTASEIYQVPLLRPTLGQLVSVYSVTLTPTSVAANTTAEQTFTVTGVTASSLVWVNKPSLTTNLGILGTRVTAANTIGITFANASSAAIVPPSETYLVAVAPAPPSAGSYLAFKSQNAISPVSYAVRNALVNTGLISGS